MRIALSMLFVVGGVLVTLWGIDTSTLLVADLSRLLSGLGEDPSIWFILSGSLLFVVGLLGLAHQSREQA